jgi:hypothetical protein
MKKAAFSFYGLIGTLLLIFWLLWLKHGGWMANANNWLLGDLRENVTSIWHISRDQNSVHYSGMNAPFGEHIEMTDCQPLYLNAIRWISQKSTFVRNRQIGWLNWMIILGQMLGAASIYLIFRRLHIPVWLAIWASVGIILVAPQQIQLAEGHFSMANLWIIPLQILILMSYEERAYRRPYSFLMAILVVAGAMIHYFFFVFSALFLTLYQIFQVAKKPNFRHFRKRLAHWIVMVLLPFAVVHFWLNLGHSVLDRPDLTANFVASRALPTHVFFPKNVIVTENSGAHTSFYIGILAVIFTIWLIARRFRFYDKSWDTEAFHRRQKRFLSGVCFAALLMLLLAVGFPFAWPGDASWLDWLGAFHPNISVGSMSFAWFFIGNILFFYVLWQISRRILRPWIKIFTFGASLFILFGEAFLTQTQNNFTKQPNFFLEKNAKSDLPKSLDFSKMQAILALPFYQNLGDNSTDFIFQQTQKAAIETGLPNFGNQFEETSVQQTAKSWQLILEPLEIPAILDEMPNNLPLAIFLDRKMSDSKLLSYRFLLEKSHFLWQNEALKILELPLDSIRASVAKNREKAWRAASNTQLFTGVNNWKSTSSELNPFQQFSWDMNPAVHIFQGQGALVAAPKDTTTLLNLPMKAGKYVFSIWQFIGEQPVWQTKFQFSDANITLNSIKLTSETGQKMAKSIVGNWIFYEYTFEISENSNICKIKILPNKNFKTPLFLDEMMVRNADADIFKTTKSWIIKNNYWFKR